MIDEAVLTTLLHDAAQRIEIPVDARRELLQSAATVDDVSERRATPTGTRPSWGKVTAIAAAITLVAGVGLSLRSSQGKSASTAKTSSLQLGGGSNRVLIHGRNIRYGRTDLYGYDKATGGSANGSTSDGAKIVQTASIELELRHRGKLHDAVDTVNRIAFLAHGYIADTKSSESADTPSAQITVRVPVDAFDSTVKSLRALGKVITSTSHGQDVTAQYVDLKAQLQAAQGEHDALALVLAKAQTIGDILAVRDRLDSNQAEINQLTGQIKLIDDQAALSSITLSMSERSKSPVAMSSTRQAGITKAWADARHGFSHAVEWIVARSGGTLVVLVALVLLVFALRYLYPVLRRGLL